MNENIANSLLAKAALKHADMPDLRLGQCFMQEIYAYDLDMYKAICGSGDSDCFYRDHLIPATYEAVSQYK